MKTFVLIHGAWHRGLCFLKVVNLLKIEGHGAFALDLPGDRETVIDFWSIDLSTYVNYVIDQIRRLDRKIILVGHSMAGMIISQVAECIPEKIEKLVYLAAFLPKNNDSLEKIVKSFASHELQNHTRLNEDEGSVSISGKIAKRFFYNCCTEAISKEAIKLLQDQPLLPFKGEVHLTEKFARVKKEYVACLKDQAISSIEQKNMYSKTECIVHTLVDADHSPFFSTPDELVRILLL